MFLGYGASGSTSSDRHLGQPRPRHSKRTDMRLHAEMPLVTFLGLMHFRVALAPEHPGLCEF